MNQRTANRNIASQKPKLQSVAQANMLAELYWFIQVIEAGSFSVAAERTGVAKSNLSRRLMQLEQRLNVQLLNRNTRLFALTTVGEQIYRHALEMLSACQAAQSAAQDAVGEPSGLIQLAAPSALSDWLLERLASFRESYPAVSFALTAKDSLMDLATQRLDLSLSLDEAPKDSPMIVARPLAQLHTVIVGSPRLLGRIGTPQRLDTLDDHWLLALGSPHALRPWQLSSGARVIHTPAFSAQNLQALRDAAKAGLGLACLPLAACTKELRNGSLLIVDLEEKPLPSVLYALTTPHKSISPATRALIQFIRDDVDTQPPEGVSSMLR